MLSFVSSLLAALPLFQFDFLLASIALGRIARNAPEYETVWDMANRVCDRWLPQPD